MRFSHPASSSLTPSTFTRPRQRWTSLIKLSRSIHRPLCQKMYLKCIVCQSAFLLKTWGHSIDSYNPFLQQAGDKTPNCKVCFPNSGKASFKIFRFPQLIWGFYSKTYTELQPKNYSLLKKSINMIFVMYQPVPSKSNHCKRIKKLSPCRHKSSYKCLQRPPLCLTLCSHTFETCQTQPMTESKILSLRGFITDITFSVFELMQ